MNLEKSVTRRDLLKSSMMFLPLIGCTKTVEKIVGPSENPYNPPSGNEPNIPSSFKYLAFRITKDNPPAGAEFFRVGIYEMDTRIKKIYGGTTLHGNWYSVVKIDSSKSYRVEIYKPQPSNPDCISAFWGLTFSDYPQFWRDSMNGFDPREDLLPVAAHLGKEENWSIVTNPWGP